ncbi:MAG: hypothetical protein OEM39_02410 [Acidimicrobiia bacterium]|nr:hypothetical protein [Acidimicrobiia bacterium]MDH3463951.1 hypothetical protein [Acidimicrobiia bacterium]
MTDATGPLKTTDSPDVTRPETFGVPSWSVPRLFGGDASTGDTGETSDNTGMSDPHTSIVADTELTAPTRSAIAP